MTAAVRLTPPLDDHGLRAIVRALAPVAELSSVGGLRGRSGDGGPRGEQRDATRALDAASDAGTLAAARRGSARLSQVALGLRCVGEWIASQGGAVRAGAGVSVEGWSLVYARGAAPTALREADERWSRVGALASQRAAVAKVHLRRTGSVVAAIEVDAAVSAAASADAQSRAARAALVAWGRGRIERFAAAWEATG